MTPTETGLLICTAEGCTEPRADQDPKATNRHCRTHRREAQKKYVLSKAEQEQAQARAAGADAFREALARRFAVYGGQPMFSGIKVAEIVRRFELPV